MSRTALPARTGHHSSRSASPLVLIVDTRPLRAIDLVYTLSDAGYRTLGPALTAEMVPLLLRKAPPSLALLNVRIDGQPSTPTARLLQGRGLQVLLMGEGREDEALAAEVLPGAPVLVEPVSTTALLAALDALALAGASGWHPPKDRGDGDAAGSAPLRPEGDRQPPPTGSADGPPPGDPK